MKRRGEGGAERRARCGSWPIRARSLPAPVRPLPALALLAVLATASLWILGCGASGSGVGAYSGVWQRVPGGEPDPSFTLRVETTGDGADLVFVDASGLEVEASARLEDGGLVMEMPASNGILDGATTLWLSLDDDGRLVVDRVLDDETTEPVWVYERGAIATQAPEP